MQRAKVFMLMAGLTALLVVLGGYIGGQGGAVMFFIMAALMNFGMYWWSDKAVLKMFKARSWGRRRRRSCTRWWIACGSGRAAHAGGGHRAAGAAERVRHGPQPREGGGVRDRGADAAGLMRLVNKQEIEGVIAHELAHIKHRHMLVGTIAATMAGAIAMIGMIVRWGLIFGRGRDGGNALGALAMAIVAPIAAMVIQLAISRQNEYQADRTGAEIAGTPDGLANALRKLESYAGRIPMDVNPAAAALAIVNPLKGQRPASAACSGRTRPRRTGSRGSRRWAAAARAADGRPAHSMGHADDARAAGPYAGRTLIILNPVAGQDDNATLRRRHRRRVRLPQRAVRPGGDVRPGHATDAGPGGGRPGLPGGLRRGRRRHPGRGGHGAGRHRHAPGPDPPGDREPGRPEPPHPHHPGGGRGGGGPWNARRWTWAGSVTAYFALVAGAGFDAATMAAATREMKGRWGFGAYVFAAVKEALKAHPVDFRITADGEVLEVRAVSVMLANVGELFAEFVPFPVPLGPRPRNSWQDGLFDVVVVAPRNVMDVPGVLWKAVGKRFKGDDDRLIHFQAKEVTIESDPPIAVQIDGDPAGETPMTAVPPSSAVSGSSRRHCPEVVTAVMGGRGRGPPRPPTTARRPPARACRDPVARRHSAIGAARSPRGRGVCVTEGRSSNDHGDVRLPAAAWDGHHA
jgi:heat shock protein HtpX